MGQTTDRETHEEKTGAGALVVACCMAASLTALALWFSSAVSADGGKHLAGPQDRGVAVNGIVAVPFIVAK